MFPTFLRHLNVDLSSSSLCNLLMVLMLVLAQAFSLSAQTQLSGTLVDEAGQTLIGATVQALPGTAATSADQQGEWQLTVTGADSLRFSYIGYPTLTYAIDQLPTDGKVVMGGSTALQQVVVAARQAGNYTSTLDARHVESITSTELKKAPCCNLGESFETNAAVDVSYRDAATGAREMQVLGLRGIYSQLLVEKRPTLYGLASPIALDLIAGTWLESIQIGKGAASVQTGPNALTGQVNTELEKGFDSDPLFVNLFASGRGRVEANVHTAKEWNQNHASKLLLHTSYNRRSHDRDHDGFYEQPGRETYSGLARHFVRTTNWEGQGNLWVARDVRQGGQTNHAAGELPGHVHRGQPYLIEQENNRIEAFAKTGYIGFARPATSMGFIASGTYHKLDNLYGLRRHEGQQRSAYATALFTSYLLSTDHQYTLGASQTYDDYQERFDQLDYDRTESASGAFAEYTYNRPGSFGASTKRMGLSVIAGLRVDHHSLGGWQALPRVNLKVNPTEALAVRASVGRAYRSAQVLAENVRFLPSSRRFVVSEPLRVESGWNYGVALTQNLQLPSERSGQLNLDVYATEFENLAVIDQESTLGFTQVYNSTGPARTISILASARLEVVKGLELKLAAKYVDSRVTYADGVSREQPYVSRYRGLLAADYETPDKRWRFNSNLQLVGPQRLPGETAFSVFGEPNTRAPLLFESPSFALVNAQLTYVVNDMLELYGGGENLTNYRQKHAILGAEDPFNASYFDASRVYAPLMGAMPYIGLRYTMLK